MAGMPRPARDPRARSPYTLRAALRRQRPLLVALLVALAIVLIGAAGNVPLAGRAMGILMLVLAGVRLAVPAQRLGALVVRTRLLDAAVLLALGAGLIALSAAPNL